MNRAQLEELACTQISDMVDQMLYLQQKGDEVGKAILHAEIKSLTAALDSDDASDNFFYAPRLRYDWIN